MTAPSPATCRTLAHRFPGATALLALLAGVGSASAQGPAAWPARGVTVVSPFAPGGPNDIIARTMAGKLSEAFGVPFTVENRGGAGATLGTGFVARATPDGHTLLVAGQSSLAFAPHLYAKLTYDPLRDFAPISNVALAPYVLAVNPRVPARSVADLVRLARAKPQAISYATSGAGSVSHLATELFAAAAGLEMVHVPYKGMVPGIGAMVAGEVDMMVADLGQVDAMVRAGKLRVLATGGRVRSPSAPDVPTLIESGFKDVVAEGRFGFLAPAGTPREIVTRIHAVLAQAAKAPDVRERFAKLGFEATSDTPEQFASLLRSDFDRYGRLIRRLGITAQ